MTPTAAMLHDIETLADGRRSVRYRFVDHTGREHITGARVVPSDYDIETGLAPAWEALTESLISTELSWIEQEVLEGRNSFAQLQYVRADLAVVYVARKLLADPDLFRVAKAAPLLTLFSNEELATLLNVAADKVIEIRAAAARAMTALQAADGYKAVL